MSETTSRSVENRFKAPQVCDWERHRSTFARLYMEEGKPLKEVISILREQHGFQATPRQYKQRIAAWGLQKNYRPEDVEDLLRHYTKDELQTKIQNGHDSSLMVKGKRLSMTYVKRYLRRISLPETSAESRKSPSSQPRSEDFIFASPNTIPPASNVPPSQRDEPATFQDRASSPCRKRFSTPLALTPGGAYRGSQDSESLDIRSASPSNNSTEALTTDKSSYEYDKEESDTRRKRRRLSKTNLALSLDTRALACPFYKQNPRRFNPQNEHTDSAMRYRTCAGPGWESISRLRQHLFRAHVASKRCRPCGLSLQSRSDFENHSLVCHADVATELFSSSETMSEEQQNALKSKQLPGRTKEESWMRIYRILFPRDSHTPSPYYQSDHETLPDAVFSDPKSGQADALMEHMCNDLPQKILTGWQEYLKSHGVTLLAELPPESAQRPSNTSSQAQRQRSAAKKTLIDPQSSVTTQELKSLVFKSVRETCTEWARSRNAQHNDPVPKLETQMVQDLYPSSFGSLLDPSPGPMSMEAHRSISYPEGGATSHLSSAGSTVPSIAPWTPQQPFVSSEWLTQMLTNDFPFYSFPNSSIVDGDFNPAIAAAASYDFSYLPVSPGIQFSDGSMQADTAVNGSLDGSAGAVFTTPTWPVPISEGDFRAWPETRVPAGTTDTRPRGSNSGP